LLSAKLIYGVEKDFNFLVRWKRGDKWWKKIRRILLGVGLLRRILGFGKLRGLIGYFAKISQGSK
jgi:hypothetical protein